MKALKELVDFTGILERINKSDLDIAGIEFGRRKNSFPVPQGFIELGSQECDPIVIEEKTGEIVLLDHEVDGRIMQYVANNLVSFISAVCVIEEHYEKCEKNESLYENENFMKKSAQQAGQNAGGEKYMHFYYRIFGI